MLKKLIDFILYGKKFRIQTFTYFIPSPGVRKSSYREKQFDKVFFQFISRGFEVLHVNTESINEGMWIVFTIRALNKKADELNLDAFFFDQYDPNEVFSCDRKDSNNSHDELS